jgi:aminoglycoside 6-adenylyltransferase
MGDDILSRIVSWAAREDPVRALVLEGSRAEKGQVDELADYDVNMFITDPGPYTQDDRWISAIADVWVYIPEKVTHHGQVFATRLVIYQAGVKVDFILYSTDVLREFARSDPLPEPYDFGYQVLLDKDSVAADMPASSLQAFRRGKPTETTFLECVHEFWFEAYHVAKYLRRRDLWPVKGRDWTTKCLLLRMIEWHERGKHGWDYRTHPLGKHMESWVATETWERLARVFAHFDAEDSWEAMFATCELFGRVARETAQSLGCRYPAEIEEHIVTFARQLRKEAAQLGAGADAQ